MCTSGMSINVSGANTDPATMAAAVRQELLRMERRNLASGGILTIEQARRAEGVGERRRQRPQAEDREVRRFAFRDIELRKASDTLTLAGYASVTEAPYEVYGGPPWGWTETIAQGAFDKTLSESPDVQLLINHEGLPLARTKSGTLRLSADNVGLAVEADLDPADPDVQRLETKMRRKDVDEMSMAFRVKRQEWDEDYEDRRITEVSLQRGDVSVVNYGANPNTHVDLRQFAGALAELRAGKTLSASTMNTLQVVLDLIARADDNVDDAQATLADLMGVENPDNADVGEVVGSSSDPEQEQNSLAWAQARASVARRRAAA